MCLYSVIDVSEFDKLFVCTVAKVRIPKSIPAILLAVFSIFVFLSETGVLKILRFLKDFKNSKSF